ncbi:hypothetical protein BJ912DRAFT_937828 [Pholiota molesta]|nr:hypothetical protein BJ912DRAFT_937828 [Pholiota molesta]
MTLYALLHAWPKIGHITREVAEGSVRSQVMLENIEGEGEKEKGPEDTSMQGETGSEVPGGETFIDGLEKDQVEDKDNGKVQQGKEKQMEEGLDKNNEDEDNEEKGEEEEGAGDVGGKPKEESDDERMDQSKQKSEEEGDEKSKEKSKAKSEEETKDKSKEEGQTQEQTKDNGGDKGEDKEDEEVDEEEVWDGSAEWHRVEEWMWVGQRDSTAEQQEWEMEDKHIRKQKAPNITKGQSKVSTQSEGENDKKKPSPIHTEKPSKPKCNGEDENNKKAEEDLQKEKKHWHNSGMQDQCYVQKTHKDMKCWRGVFSLWRPHSNTSAEMDQMKEIKNEFEAMRHCVHELALERGASRDPKGKGKQVEEESEESEEEETSALDEN